MIEITREPSSKGREVLTFSGVDLASIKSRTSDRSATITQKKTRHSARLQQDIPSDVMPPAKIKPKSTPVTPMEVPPSIPITDAPFVVKELLHKAWLIFYNNYFLYFRDDLMPVEKKKIAEISSYALHTLHERLFVDAVHARPGKRDKWEITGMGKVSLLPDDYDAFSLDLSTILAAGEAKEAVSDMYIPLSKDRISMVLLQLISVLVQTWDCYLNEDLATTVLWPYGESEFISLLNRHPGEYVKWKLPERIVNPEVESTRSQNAQRRRQNTAPSTPATTPKPTAATIDSSLILAMDKSLSAPDKAAFKLLDELFRGDVLENKVNMMYFSNFLNPGLLIQETTDPFLSYFHSPHYTQKWKEEKEEILERINESPDAEFLMAQVDEIPDGEPDDNAFDEISQLLAYKQERLRILAQKNQYDREAIVRRVIEGKIDDRLLVSLERDHLMRNVYKIIEVWFVSEGKIKEIEDPKTLALLAARAPAYLKEVMSAIKTHASPDSAEVVIGVDLIKEISNYLETYNKDDLKQQILDYIAKNPVSSAISPTFDETQESEVKTEQ